MTIAETMELAPTTEHKLGSVRIRAYGKPANYRVEDFNSLGSFLNIRKTLPHLASHTDTLLMPQPGFNAACIASHDLRVSLVQPNSRKSIRVGAKADAIILDPGESMAWASGDCHTILMWNAKTKQVASIHGARDALLPAHLRNTKPHGTDILDNSPDDVITTTLRTTGWQGRDVSVFSCVGIAHYSFFHSTTDVQYGRHNSEVVWFLRDTYGETCVRGEKGAERLDIESIIRAISVIHGIAPSAVAHDNVDTYAEPNRWWSHRRFIEQSKAIDGRNLVVVENCFN